MLQRTAEAMTVLLCENIGRDELKTRLRMGDQELDAQLDALEGDERLSRYHSEFAEADPRSALIRALRSRPRSPGLKSEQAVRLPPTSAALRPQRLALLAATSSLWRSLDQRPGGLRCGDGPLVELACFVGAAGVAL